MNHHETPQLKAGAILIVILIFFIFLLSGCEKSEIPQYKESDLILIDLSDDSSYTFTDLNKAEDCCHVIKNGEGKYSFTIEGNTVTIGSTQEIVKALHFSSMFKQAVKTELELIGKNTV